MADNESDKKTRFFPWKIVCVLLMLMLALQLYIVFRPSPESPRHMQEGGLQTQVAPDLSASQQTSTQNPKPDNETEELPVAFRVSGRVDKMFFAEHAAIKQGDILAVLDREPFEKSLANAMTRVQVTQDRKARPVPNSNFKVIEAARANVEDAQHAYDAAVDERTKYEHRLIKAGQTDNVDQDNIQNEHDAKMNLEKLQRELAHQEEIGRAVAQDEESKEVKQIAKNGLLDAEFDLADTQLIAPSDGVIISRNVEVGATVSPGDTVYVLSIPKTAPAHFQ